MDANLRLQVIFGAIDKLSAPLRRLRDGAKGLSGDVAKTSRELANLRRAQGQIAGFRSAEARLKATSVQLDQVRAKTAALRAETERVAAPTARMKAALERAERAEGKLTERHEREGAALQQLGGKLQAAGLGIEHLSDHEKRLGDQVDQTTRKLEGQRSRAERMARFRERGEKLKGAGQNIVGAGAVATVGITAPVVALLSGSIGAAKESAQAMAQVDAALASMGPRAGRTAPQLQALSGKLQDLSLYDDDDILRQVTANMLTFGRVAGTEFDRAQQAAVNISARLGKDLQSSALMVGKALNEPVKGLTALSRAGIQFTDQQKAQIKAMAAAGNIAGAQRIMLGELESQFGGAARAAREASPDGRMQQSWRTMQETIGALAMTALPPLLDAVTRLMDGFNSLDPSTQTFLVGAIALAAALGPLLGIIGSIITIVGGVAAAFSIGFLPAIGIILAVIAAVSLLGYAAYKIYQNWGPIKAWFASLWDVIVAKVRGAVDWFRSLVPMFKTIGAMMLEGLLSALNPLRLVKHIMSLGSRAVAALKGVLGIHSPSRVFAAIGGHMMTGLAGGLDRGATKPLARLRAAGLRMAAAMGAAAPPAALARTGADLSAKMASAPGLRATDRPTRASTAPSATPAGDIHINIYQRPGEHGAAFARRVAQEVERIRRGESARAESSYEDTD